MKKIIDEDFLLNKKKYISQCIIVALFYSIILIFLDFVVKITIVASLGATCFIIFTIPHKNASRIQYVLGGYTVGIVVGSLCVLGEYLMPAIVLSIWGAVAIGLSMFLMVILNFEHPPAAALSLGIVIGGINFKTVIMLYSIITLMLLVRWGLRKWLIDLV
ncbi:MAG: HPP family protein [Mobilitalea sp.]